jgi:putative SOS response-associated peptidase YedK
MPGHVSLDSDDNPENGIISYFKIDRIIHQPNDGKTGSIGTPNPVVVLARDGKRELRPMRWGLIRQWHRPKMMKPHNARSESIDRKPMFRDLIRRRRCIVPIEGYYESVVEDDRKVSYLIRPTDQPLFGLAAIYDAWLDDQGELKASYTLITTEPAKSIAHLHPRMPVILHPEDHERYLHPDRADLKTVLSLLRPYPSNHLTAHRVN